MKRGQRYVVKCIKSNRNKFGFGFFHKAGQYVAHSGEGTNDINKAFVYSMDEDDCGVIDLVGWEGYYQFVPVEVTIKEKK